MTDNKNATIVVLISGSGSNLQAFIDAKNAGLLDADIAAVISNKSDAYGLERARQAGIQTHLIEHQSFESRDAFDRVVADTIEQYQPTLVILAGFMRILTSEFVHRFAGRLVNIHPALLPKFKGLHTHQRAIDAGEKWHGSSVHFVTEELDGGPVIAQARVAIQSDDNEQTLNDKVQAMEHKLYPKVAQWFVSGRLKYTKTGLFFDDKKLEHPVIIEQQDLLSANEDGIG